VEFQGVLLRVAYGANTFTATEGFAFDNFKVYESPAVDIKVSRNYTPLLVVG